MAESLEPTHYIAVDGSRNSEYAFWWACRNIPRNHRFVIFHGKYEPPRFKALMFPDPSEEREQLVKEVEQEHYEILDKYFTFCKDANRKCSIKTALYRSPRELGGKICDQALSGGAESVVCASRGLGTFGKAIFGSTSSSILNECDIPVSVVRSPPRYTPQ
eukprot:TRINITY_DN8300_c0_g4_i2.p1 TRINITY_DN8300_c0_g4~~TRINITY_DN8300_c0_g4_i2.p1  ORF type:complete len:161 (+),score=16.54 TRINITY_DN8300_c0_g4_i2:109-591(+)